MIHKNPPETLPEYVGLEYWFDLILNRWLSVGIVLVILGQLAVWAPLYLTWPYWADHDVFANAARSWTHGELPYRDVRLNNFPGTIYLFWILGQVFGWGHTMAFYALDLTFLLTLGVTLTVWSRRRFGHFWPGMLGFLVYMSTALSLDYTLAAQRDWQAPVLAVLAILIVQTFEGKTASLIVAAALSAAGFTIRPQVILLWPAVMLAAGRVDTTERLGVSIRRCAVWVAATLGFLFLFMLPLIGAGIFDDFLNSIRVVAPGGSYNRTGFARIPYRWFRNSILLQWWATAGTLLVLILQTRSPQNRRLGWDWLIALGGASLYFPISPSSLAYLELPLKLLGAMASAAIFGLVASKSIGPPSLRLIVVLGIAALGGTSFYPALCSFTITTQGVKSLLSKTPFKATPPGYRQGAIIVAAYFPWEDYKGTLDYLRSHTSPTTRVANMVVQDPAIVSAVDRQSAFPAEGVTWLRMVRKSDAPLFEQSLKDADDSVVVWNPHTLPTEPSDQLYPLFQLVPRLYQFEARFGDLEVWRRKPNTAE